MDFKNAALLGSFISKDYAEDLFRLLSAYSSISASEAASRLDLHIKTAQDFLEAMHDLGILERKEVYEKKRPYYRYKLKVSRISVDIDLAAMAPREDLNDRTSAKIREKKNAGARFTASRDNRYVSNIAVWTGQGRERTERKINLSPPRVNFSTSSPSPAPVF